MLIWECFLVLVLFPVALIEYRGKQLREWSICFSSQYLFRSHNREIKMPDLKSANHIHSQNRKRIPACTPVLNNLSPLFLSSGSSAKGMVPPLVGSLPTLVNILKSFSYRHACRLTCSKMVMYWNYSQVI